MSRPTTWIVLLVAAVLVVFFWPRREEEREPSPMPPIRPPMVEEPWGTSVVFDRFELSMPRSWFEKPELAMQHGMLFRGPSDDGHPPVVQLYWGPWSGEPQGFFEHERARRVPGVQDILEEGEAVVAGLPARYLVYEHASGGKGATREAEYLTIDWYFARDGRGGILRGLAPAQAFRFRYRPIFTEIARKLRYRPSR